ncbi:MAG: transposase [Planctomycetes bacterium]|nr:transposase [Planctomycetota bacterium]
MPTIGRFPPFGKRFFRRARKLIGSCHFAHFWRAVVAIAALQGRRSLSKIEAACRHHRTRQSIGFFLKQAHWNAPEVLTETAIDTLKGLGWKPGEAVDVVLDDTQKKKRGKFMDAVSKIFLHAEKVYAQGHTILGCAIVYRRVVIPCAVRLWASEAFCKTTRKKSYDGAPIDFRKLTELAGDIVAELPLSNVTVLFDSYYLCPNVVRACEAKKYRYVGVAKKNRNFFPDGRDRDKRKLGTYGKNVLKREGKWTSCRDKKYRLAQRVGRLSKIGRVKLIFSRRAREKSWISMATNATRWGALRVLSHYLDRWPIEVFFKESKQYLGLGDYQMLRYRGVVKYLHLVLIAHLLLTHLGAAAQGAQAESDKSKPLDIESVPQLQITLREKLWDDTINSMEKGSRNKRVGKKLKQIMLFKS